MTRHWASITHGWPTQLSRDFAAYFIQTDLQVRAHEKHQTHMVEHGRLPWLLLRPTDSLGEPALALNKYYVRVAGPHHLANALANSAATAAMVFKTARCPIGHGVAQAARAGNDYCPPR